MSDESEFSNPPSRSQIRKLGSRLRKEEPASLQDLELLEAVRNVYGGALGEVVRVLVNEGLAPSFRLKTTQTIIEKLQRNQSMALTTMQDIAGARIVADMSRPDQDQMVQRVTTLFPQAQVVDRRIEPSYGYRAVHIIVNVSGYPVEIQVRTHLQDLWAQLLERLADRWGRQIRYGEPPNPDREGQSGPSRQAVLDSVMAVSERIDQQERLQAAMVKLNEELKGLVAKFEEAKLDLQKADAETRSFFKNIGMST